jgi:hypothetical protein
MAYKALPAKNTLIVSDARLVQVAFELRLSMLEDATERTQNGRQSSLPGADEKGDPGDPSEASSKAREPSSVAGSTERQPGRARSGRIDKSVLNIPEARRYRDKAHLQFVASQPCLVCGRKPADPHHLRFAQARALGRKVSDEFTVPLCRTHHRELHRSGSEFRWWEATGIDPLKIARKLWKNTRLNGLAGRAQPLPRTAATDVATGEPQPVGADRSPPSAP